MAVVIEELKAEVAPAPPPAAAASAPAPAAMDERKVLEVIALDHWMHHRLLAD